MPNKQKTDSAAVVRSKLQILKQRVQSTLSTLNRAVTDNYLTLAVQWQQNLDDQLTQLEEQTFAAIDLAESTDEHDLLTDDLLQVTLEADTLKLQVLELITKALPSNDGVNRSFELRCQKGKIIKPVVKLPPIVP